MKRTRRQRAGLARCWTSPLKQAMQMTKGRHPEESLSSARWRSLPLGSWSTGTCPWGRQISGRPPSISRPARGFQSTLFLCEHYPVSNRSWARNPYLHRQAVLVDSGRTTVAWILVGVCTSGGMCSQVSGVSAVNDACASWGCASAGNVLRKLRRALAMASSTAGLWPLPGIRRRAQSIPMPTQIDKSITQVIANLVQNCRPMKSAEVQIAGPGSLANRHGIQDCVLGR